MAVFGGISVFLLTLAMGFGLQLALKWNTWPNLLLSLVLLVFLPVLWGSGLVCGILLASSFFTARPVKEKKIDSPSPVNIGKVILAALLVFSGFLLSLVYLMRLEGAQVVVNPFWEEMMGWLFLIFVEVCLLKAIAKETPLPYRLLMGLGIAFLVFLMLIYWTYPYGIVGGILVFFTLFFLIPLLLKIVDRPKGAGGYTLVKNR